MKYVLPPLPYDFADLEPHIDEKTMRLHYSMHHATYVKSLNLALETAPDLLRGKTAEWLLLNLNKIPEKLRSTIRHHAGGHVNHSFFWQGLSPVDSMPSVELAKAIDHSFGSFEKFKIAFEEAGSKVFGSGWVWLVKARIDNDLRILTTSGHDNPITQGYTTLLVNDVWEHAYYLKHQNRRPEYLKDVWPVVNWVEVARRYEDSLSIIERHLKTYEL